METAVDLRQIECFAALFEEGSVTRAARRLNIVQPALSARVARMEADLGERLFERSPQGMRPTLAGTRAYEAFTPVLASFREARRSFSRQGEDGAGRISAGFVASVADSVLASSLARFLERFPAVEVTAFEGYSSLMFDWVRAGLVDFAVINDVVEDPQLRTTPLLEEPFLLIGREDAPLPPGPLAPVALAGLRMVLPTKRHGLRVSLDRMTERERLSLEVRLELDSMNAIGRLVREPGWFTLLPPLALGGAQAWAGLRGRVVDAPGLRRTLVCAHGARRPLAVPARRLVAMLEEDLVKQAQALRSFV